MILKILNDSANEVKKRLYKATRIRSLEDTITYICGGKKFKEEWIQDELTQGLLADFNVEFLRISADK